MKQLLDQFACVRITRMNDVDIALFQFDFDLTWACFFLDGNDRIYSRYGGRDAKSAEDRVSVAGLKHTMRCVLADHTPPAEAKPRGKATPAHEVYTGARGCIHCHNVWTGLRDQARADGAFTRESLFVYPLPENIGLELDVVAGNHVKAVKPGSASQAAGIQPGDVLTSIDATAIRSQADVSRALHLAPYEGRIVVHWRRGQANESATLEVRRGWKETNLSWRTSMRREHQEPE